MSGFKASMFCQVLLFLVLTLPFQTEVLSAINDFDKSVLHPAIPLLDEDGLHVLDSHKPYSTRQSCGSAGGGCHDIDKISNAYHFEMGRNEFDDQYGNKRGVVPVVSPGYFGGYNCMLANDPLWLSKKSNSSVGEFLDYGAPGLVQACGGCHNGGGFAEKDRNGNRYDKTASTKISPLDGDYYEWQGATTPTAWDWKKSGVVEPDCLLCHADFSQLKTPSPAANNAEVKCQGMDCSLAGVDQWTNLRANLLLKKGYFRYANSAIFNFLDIDPGSEEKLLLSTIANLDGNTTPALQWNPAAFDSNRKMQMRMLRFPANDNCMLCHNTSHKRRGFYGFGPESLVEIGSDGNPTDDYHDDVHKGKSWTEKGETRSIENCNACHSKQYYKKSYLNVDLDADHNFLMGNSDQDVRRDLNFQPGPLSCEHCHGGEAYGSAEKPALPLSKKTTLKAAHLFLWTANGDMNYSNSDASYPAKCVQIHLDKVACQACHIPKVKNNGEDIKILYRKHEVEDGKLKSMPYQATPRYYWWDKTNKRMVSRKERLQVSNNDAAPQSYDEVKQIKADLDALLTQQGFQNVDTQLVWTESNDYLLSHNTKPGKLTMPCDDCHSRDQSNRRVNSARKSDGIYGVQNMRVVASMADKTAYPRLIEEGLVKLDLTYFEVDGNGKIVENVKSILDDSEIEPFTSALRTTSQTVMEGEFRQVGREEAASVLADDLVAIQAVSQLSDQDLYLFNSRITGEKIKDVAVLLGYDTISKNIVPNYRLEVSARYWTSMIQRVGNKKTKPIKNITIKQGKLAGQTSSLLFDFVLQDQQKQRAHSLADHKMLVKLPYAGAATSPAEVALLAVTTDSDGLVTKKNPLSLAAAEIVSVVQGSHVTVLVNELPEHALLYDLKLKKKK
jgi:hypothetical protein